jgi:multidrug efflux pump subunit AcrA (membrane-fusion protein)
VVIVAKDGGRFEPREVQLGVSSGAMQQVTHGLTAGEKVVTSSQFLIDSESNLKAAISQLLDDTPEQTDEMAPMAAGHQH